jgi:hypothetical protein
MKGYESSRVGVVVRVLARAAGPLVGSQSRSIAKAFSIRCMRVSGFFALWPSRRLSAGISGSDLGLLRLLVIRDVMARTSYSSSQPPVMISGYGGVPGSR